jgi:hypothetical protein
VPPESTASLVAALRELKDTVRHLESVVPTLATRTDLEDFKRGVKEDYATKDSVKENSKDIDTIIADNKKIMYMLLGSLIAAAVELILRSKGVG